MPSIRSSRVASEGIQKRVTRVGVIHPPYDSVINCVFATASILPAHGSARFEYLQRSSRRRCLFVLPAFLAKQCDETDGPSDNSRIPENPPVTEALGQMTVAAGSTCAKASPSDAGSSGSSWSWMTSASASKLEARRQRFDLVPAETDTLLEAGAHPLHHRWAEARSSRP